MSPSVAVALAFALSAAPAPKPAEPAAKAAPKVAEPAKPPEGGPKLPPPPPAPKVNGITVADPFPQGCVDCHKNQPEMNFDATLAPMLEKWKTAVPPELLELAKKAATPGATVKGKHPDVSDVKLIPQDCVRCHKADSKMGPPMRRLAHLIHLSGGEKNHFIAYYGAQCTNCHKVDMATGAVTLKQQAK